MGPATASCAKRSRPASTLDYAALNNLGVAYSFLAAFPLSAATLKKALALKLREPGLLEVYFDPHGL